MNQRTVGGGPAVGLGQDWTQMLQGALQTGSFGATTAGQRFGGADPTGQSQGMFSILNDILSGGAGQMGGSMQQMISKQSERDAQNLRARFGQQGGQAFGTPAAYAEAMLRSETAPKMTQAIGGLQLQALMPLLQMMSGTANKGISQAETVMQPSGFSQFLGTAAPVLGAVAGGPLGGMLGGMFGGGAQLPGMSNFGGFDIPSMNFYNR